MMSYTNGLTPQFGGIISSMATALSGIKNGTFARYLTNGQKTRWKGTNTATLSEKNDEIKTEKEPISREDYTVLEDLGLEHLPKDWTVQIDSLFNIKPQPETNPWFVSHISSDSFYRNKHGFTESEPSHSNPYVTVLSRFLQLKRPLNVNMKRFAHSWTSSRIQTLEDRANAEEDNPRAQAEYLREMLTHDPEYVVRRYESGRYAKDDTVKKEYLKALVLTERVNSEDIEKLSTGNPFGFEKGFDFFSKKGKDGKNVTGAGTKDSPIHVTVQKEQGSVFLEQLFGLIRFLIAIVLIVSVLESQLKMKMSNPKEVTPDNGDKKFKFSDVEGVEEAKAELQEVVEFLRNPSKFTKLGGKLPTGVLLIGAPGTGKTLLAKAVAGEAGVPFFFCSGAEFDEMFVGVGAARVRNLFAAAREHAPCIIFVDELDAIGGTRVVNNVQPYSRMTLNQLLVELDGFEKSEGIVVIGATNFPETLDKALVRPGRFDTKIDVPVPDVKGRYNILKVHTKNIHISDDVDLKVLARGTPGFTGADLANLVNQAAIKAASEGESAVTTSHLEFAKDKIVMGPERKSMVIADMNKKLVAYHEGGHAIVAYYTPGSIPLHKATIIPRGQALGMVSQLPEADDLQWTKKQLLAKLDVCMGGRVAEEIIFGKENVTTGASSDSEQATKIATAMVTRYCMSDKVGMVQVTDQDKLSPETQSLIEGEVKKLLMDSYERARNVINTHAKEHLRLAEALLKYETLDAKEIELVLQGKPLERML